MPTITVEKAKPLPEGCELKWPSYFRNIDSALAFVNKVNTEIGRGYAGKINTTYSRSEVYAAIERESEKFSRNAVPRRIHLPNWVPRYYIKDVPKEHAGWFGDILDYPYLAHKNDEKGTNYLVAYTPTFDHLMRDRQLVVPFSTYLARCEAGLSGDEISKLTARFLAEFSDATLKFTRDRSKVLQIFTKYEHKAEASDYTSCMNYGPGEYGLPDDMHPAHAYVAEGSTFSIAYLENDSGRVLARSVVSEKNKIFVRVYGIQEQHKCQMVMALEAAGFKRAGAYEGERIAIIKHPKKSDHIIVPYIDGQIKHIDSDGNIDKDGEIDCETTAGCVYCPPPCCQKTGVKFGIGKLRRTTVYICYPGTTEDWTLAAAKEHGFLCEYIGAYFANTAAKPIEVFYSVFEKNTTQIWADCFVTTTGARPAAAFFCNKTKKFYSTSHTKVNVVVDVVDGALVTETWCREATTGLHFRVAKSDLGGCPQWSRLHYKLVSKDFWSSVVNPSIAEYKSNNPNASDINIKADSTRDFVVGDIVYLDPTKALHYLDYCFDKPAQITAIDSSAKRDLVVTIKWLHEEASYPTSRAKLEWLIHKENYTLEGCEDSIF